MTNIRRVITGIGSDGRSRIVRDGASGCVLEFAPGLRLTDLWETTAAKDAGDPAHDGAARPLKLEPPPGGSILRIIDYPPDREWRPKLSAAKAFERMGAADVLAHGAKDALMHRTETIDYIVVLEGEIHALMEDGEAHLKAGDVLIQRATTHSWENRSDRPCRFAVVLVSTRPAPAPGESA
jgi:mannose-6-phosphate isomerase-like protein (cupin superfamily)